MCPTPPPAEPGPFAWEERPPTSEPELDLEQQDAEASEAIEREFDLEPQPRDPGGDGRRWQPLWRNLLDAGLGGDQLDSVERRRIRSVNVTLLAMILFSVPLSLGSLLLGLPYLAAGIAGTGLFAGLNIVALRRTHNPVASGHLAVGALYLLVLASNLSGGGFYDPSFGWFFVVPLVAGVLMNVRTAWFWTSLVALTAVVQWALPEWGVEVTNRIPPELHSYQSLVNRLSMLMGVGLLLTLFVRAQRRAEDEIRDLAFNDPLTGLPNRQSFRDSLDQALHAAERNGSSLALLFVDLDRFKEYNDTLGHSAGDEVLRWVGEILQGRVRSSDIVVRPEKSEVSVSRLGGDEFTVVLSDVGSKQRTAQAAQRLLDSLGEPLTIGGVEVFVSASIGVAVYPDDGRDVDALLRRADAAMYSAKQRGGNTFEFFSPWMNEASLRQVFIENRLRRATVRDEMQVLYQPIFDARDGRVVAAEALVRWNSPSMGEVPPAEFIPVAEETGLIAGIGDWVLSTALEQLCAWHRAGLPRIRMSVNYSAAQLRRERGLESLFETLEQIGVKTEELELEITERMVLREDEPIIEGLRRLRRRGVGIALDDFGTGYSSLNYLRRLPLDRVKIDRSFVATVISNPQDANLTSAIVAMAKSLRLGVIAEGVESPDQMEYLRTVGCDELQGHLLSRPVEAGDFAELLARNAERGSEPSGGMRELGKTS